MVSSLANPLVARGRDVLSANTNSSMASGHRFRLRQRYLKTGLHGFTDTEVVELLLCLAIPRGDVKPQARELIARFGSLRRVFDAGAEELGAVQGLGEAAVAGLKLVREAGALYLRPKVEQGEQFRDFESLKD